MYRGHGKRADVGRQQLTVSLDVRLQQGRQLLQVTGHRLGGGQHHDVLDDVDRDALGLQLLEVLLVEFELLAEGVRPADGESGHPRVRQASLGLSDLTFEDRDFLFHPNTPM